LSVLSFPLPAVGGGNGGVEFVVELAEDGDDRR